MDIFSPVKSTHRKNSLETTVIGDNIDFNIRTDLDIDSYGERNSIINGNNDNDNNDNNNDGFSDLKSNFQYKVLENVVNECLEDFKTTLHRDIMDMHVELIRQFHIQQVFISSYIKLSNFK